MKMCDFYMENIVFLGYVFSLNGIEMDEKKVRVIQE
jgi:hypothetical protein